MSQKRKQRKFKDRCVIYESAADKCWIAHSLGTDQIGTGDCVLDALVDLMRAIHTLLEIAAEEDGITIFREAPAAIRQKTEDAQPLPGEIYEIAHKMVTGDWPSDLQLGVTAQHPKRWETEIVEEGALVPA